MTYCRLNINQYVLPSIDVLLGSGSTWVRYLIEGATGVFTGNIYILYNLGSLNFHLLYSNMSPITP